MRASVYLFGGPTQDAASGWAEGGTAGASGRLEGRLGQDRLTLGEQDLSSNFTLVHFWTDESLG